MKDGNIIMTNEEIDRIVEDLYEDDFELYRYLYHRLEGKSERYIEDLAKELQSNKDYLHWFVSKDK